MNDGTRNETNAVPTNARMPAQTDEGLKKAGDELDHHPAIFRLFADASSQPFAMADLKGQLTYVNPAMCRLLGEDCPANMVGKHLTSYCSQEYLQKRQREIFPTLLRDSYWQGEGVVYSRQGQAKIIHQDAFLVRDNNGKPLRLAAAITDITERRAIEEALRTSDEKYKTLIEACPDGVIQTDLEGHILYASRWFADMNLVSDPAEMLGKTPPHYIALEDHPQFFDHLDRASQERITREFQYRVVRMDGTTFPVEVSTAMIRDRDGNPISMLAQVRDVNQRQQAAAALRQSHDELRAIYEGMIDGLLIADIETKRFYRANSTMCRMLGYSEEELLRLSIMDIHPPETLPATFQSFHAKAAGNLRVRENAPVLRKDGSVFHADIAGNAVTYHGRPCLLGIFRDVTERWRSQEALQRERRTLQHMLESSDHERQLIAYEIHDGLAQYLTGSLMQLQLSSHLRTENPEEAAKSLDAGVVMLRESLAEARRLISGVRPPILDESGVVAAVAHLVYELRARRGPKVEFRSKVDFGRLPAILENAIYRIVQEGLSNAWKHSQSKRVTVRLIQQGDRLRIEIQDRGIGFCLQDVKDGRFGLEGIRERARLLGGTATIESQPGKGTRVLVELPLPRPQEDD